MGYFLMTEADIKEAEYLIIENNIYFTMKDINKALEEGRKLNDKKYNKDMIKDSKNKIKTEVKSKKETEKKIYKKKEDNKYNNI
jgi:hypothetical protein